MYRNKKFVRSRRLIDMILKCKNEGEEDDIMQNTERPAPCESYEDQFSLLNTKNREDKTFSNLSPTTTSLLSSSSKNNHNRCKALLANNIADVEGSSHINTNYEFCDQRDIMSSPAFSNISSVRPDDLANIDEITPTIIDLMPGYSSVNASEIQERNPESSLILISISNNHTAKSDSGNAENGGETSMYIDKPTTSTDNMVQTGVELELYSNLDPDPVVVDSANCNNLVYATLTNCIIPPPSPNGYDQNGIDVSVESMNVNEAFTTNPESPSILISNLNNHTAKSDSGNAENGGETSMCIDELTNSTDNMIRTGVELGVSSNLDPVPVVVDSARCNEITNNTAVKRNRIRDRKERLEYDKNNHTMLPACDAHCRQKCDEKFTEDKRKSLWESFWTMELQRRRDFIVRNVSKDKTKWKTTENSTRSYTYTYTLESQKVCKTFFLSTLGYKHDRIVRSVIKELSLNNVCAVPDKRGRHEPINKFNAEFNNEIRSFIEKHKPMKSHYTIKNAPNRRYLPIGCTFTSIFNDFNQSQKDIGEPTCSWGHFHKVISDMNISCSMPAQDKCLKCTLHEEKHSETEGHDCSSCECSACDNFTLHVKNKNESRKHLHEDTEAVANNPKKEVFSVDMQKVLLMPKLDHKEYFFLRKLVLFNETFASPGKNLPAYCLLWHEGESGRKAHNIASAFILFLKTFARDLEEIYIYCDNCSAQNKNKVLFCSLVRYINTNDCDTKLIKIEYLEPGHTYMPADGVHGAITRKINKTPNMYDVQDFTNIISQARKECNVKYFEHQEVYMFQNEAKAIFPKGYNISNLKIIEFRRGETSMFGKNDYEQENFKELKIFNAKLVEELRKNIGDGFTADTLENIPKQKEPRGITKEKKDDLMKMVQSMPSNRRVFFNNLKVNENVVDLGVGQDI